MRRTRSGRFLVLEGLDGAGTTTQAERLAAWLRARGRRVQVTAEPSRRDHLASEVEPLLARGVDVVSDRFTLSSLAYQAVALAGGRSPGAPRSPMAWVRELNRLARAPDLTIFLEVSAAAALARRRAASTGRDLFEVPSFQRLVARAYAQALRLVRAAGERVAVVDGDGSVEAVAASVSRAAATLI